MCLTKCSHCLHAAVPPFCLALSQWAKRSRNDSSGNTRIAEECMHICFASELSKPWYWLQGQLNLVFVSFYCHVAHTALNGEGLLTFQLWHWNAMILFLWPAFYIFFHFPSVPRNLVIYSFLEKSSHVILWGRAQDKPETGIFCIFLFYCIWSPREKDTIVRTSDLCQIGL